MRPDPTQAGLPNAEHSTARRRSLLGRHRAGFATAAAFSIVVLFYVTTGYLGSSNMFGDHPLWRGMNRGPSDFGLAGETVSFASLDGVPLKAWWLHPSGVPRGAIIVAHGIDHTRQVMLPRAGFLVGGGYDVLLIDLRGHGESGGSIVSPGLLESRDVLAGVRYIRSRGLSEPIAALGVSYGAVASLIATAESRDIAAVISDGAFPTGKGVSEDICRHYLRDSRTNVWVRAQFLASTFPGVARATELVYYLRSGIDLGPDLVSVIPWATRIRVPVLIITGEQDWIVPPDRAQELFSAIPVRGKEFVVIPKARHDTTYTVGAALYETSALEFLARSIKSNKSTGVRMVNPRTGVGQKPVCSTQWAQFKVRFGTAPLVISSTPLAPNAAPRATQVRVSAEIRDHWDLLRSHIAVVQSSPP